MLLNDIAPTFKFFDKSKISCKAWRVDVVSGTSVLAVPTKTLRRRRQTRPSDGCLDWWTAAKELAVAISGPGLYNSSLIFSRAFVHD